MLTYPEQTPEQISRRQAAGLLAHAADVMKWDKEVSAQIGALAERLGHKRAEAAQ